MWNTILSIACSAMVFYNAAHIKLLPYFYELSSYFLSCIPITFEIPSCNCLLSTNCADDRDKIRWWNFSFTHYERNPILEFKQALLWNWNAIISWPRRKCFMINQWQRKHLLISIKDCYNQGVLVYQYCFKFDDYPVDKYEEYNCHYYIRIWLIYLSKSEHSLPHQCYNQHALLSTPVLTQKEPNSSLWW